MIGDTFSHSMPALVTPHAQYAAHVADFRSSSPEQILGVLTANAAFDVDTTQIAAWKEEIIVLKEALAGLGGAILLEFVVPRIGSRLDAVLVSQGVVFAIEFKVGESAFHRPYLDQVWDYALDLKNFHKGSVDVPIVPLLVATQATSSDSKLTIPHSDRVYPPLTCNPIGLAGLLRLGLGEIKSPAIDVAAWSNAPYQPTPTIIEAAQALYSSHSVEAIARSDAGARNLRVTSRRVEQIVEEARDKRRKAIVFVTGVPGAGKTLVGLNIATKKRKGEKQTLATFLTGNTPLMAVLREALTRDEFARVKRREKAARDEGASPPLRRARKGDVAQEVKAFIQNVHHFRDASLKNSSAPADQVVIFDEAQRAWNRQKTSAFMKRKKGVGDFAHSEPEFLMGYMDRHGDWAVVVCLVGGGQEINDGEAGISAWLEAVKEQFPDWDVHISPELTDTEYSAGHAIDQLAGRANVAMDPALHLSVSMRSFRAEKVSSFVKALLDCDEASARDALRDLSQKYPIVLTRDLAKAKRWVRERARGSERVGLVASSEAQRLKPHAIDVRHEVNPVHWFLGEPTDTRSSFYLEDAATQFQVQGLELDWACVTWDADLRRNARGWDFKSFKGKGWQNINKRENQRYLLNAYRVLLTRARQGMAIFIPTGDSADPTRAPANYQSTFRYLVDLGIPTM